MKAEAGPETTAGENVARVIAEARAWFRVGQMDQAKTTCAQLLDEGAAYREVYLLLADIYRFEGEGRKADETLKMAAEAPSTPGWPPTGTDKATARARRQVWVAPPLPVYRTVLIGGGLLALAAAVAAHWMPAQFTWLGINLAQMLMIATAGFLGMGSLAASGLIRTFDQELTDLGPGDDLPVWVYLLAAGVFSAFLALGIFLWSAVVRGEYSRTTLSVLGALVVLGTVSGIAVGGSLAFWWMGLNVLWESCLFGWALGSIASPREWWQK